MPFDAIKLFFTGAVHLGRGSEELDRSETVYHSDSLRAALYAVGRAYHKDWENEQRYFDSFRISSCFPFAHGEYFLPRPMLNTRFVFEQTDENRAAKKAKKIEFLSHRVFERFVNAPNGQLSLSENCLTPDGVFACTSPETAKKVFFRAGVQQRVAVPHEDQSADARPFYSDRLHFEAGCGLYFLAQFSNDIIRKQVLQTIRLLGDSGIGTDRTVGNGLFEFKPERDVDKDVSLLLNGIHQQQLALGLYLPEKREFDNVDLNQSHWQLLKRGGYMGGTDQTEFLSLRKKSIYMFGAGSVFRTEQSLKGAYCDLKPDWNVPMHPVWRDGKCLFVSI